jgi:hypothetical protein
MEVAGATALHHTMTTQIAGAKPCYINAASAKGHAATRSPKRREIECRREVPLTCFHVAAQGGATQKQCDRFQATSNWRNPSSPSGWGNRA